MSFHVSEGGLEGLLPSPGGSSSAPSYGYQRRDQHYHSTRQGQSATASHDRHARTGLAVFPRHIVLTRRAQTNEAPRRAVLRPALATS